MRAGHEAHCLDCAAVHCSRGQIARHVLQFGRINCLSEEQTDRYVFFCMSFVVMQNCHISFGLLGSNPRPLADNVGCEGRQWL